MLLSILIPVFNEEKTISRILEKVIDAKIQSKINREIVLVDDGSTDGTVEILSKKLKKYKGLVKLIFKQHPKNLGKGAAVRTAVQNASGDILIIQDADLEYDPNDYMRLLDPILKRKTRVVYGTRLKDYPLRLWGEGKTVLPSHWLANKVLTGLTNLIYGSNLTDMETGYKVFKADILKGLRLEAQKFDFEPEITAKLLKKGIKIYEVEIMTSPRTHNEGKKIKWHDGIAAVWTLVKYRFVS